MNWKNTIVLPAIVLSLVACNQLHEDTNVNESTTYITNDTVSEIRTKVNALPIAEYVKYLGDKASKDWKFSVNIYETKERFKFLLRMKCTRTGYTEMNETDTLKIPNFGIQPKVEIHKGNDEFSCIIGFLDKKGEFKEYKQVAIKDNQMKLTTLRKYFVGVYKTVSH